MRRVVLVATLASCLAQAQAPEQSKTGPASWKPSEQQFMDARKREQVMDYAGARRSYEAAWQTLQENRGWPADWGSRVAWELGVATAYTCSDFDKALEYLDQAYLLNASTLPLDLARQGRIARDAARVAFQAGRFGYSVEQYRAALAQLGPNLNQRSPLLLAEFLEEFVPALRRAGETGEAQAVAAQASNIRAATPPNPLMARPTPTLSQICGAPRDR